MTGIYECMTRGCAEREKKVERPYDPMWPLERRQRNCPSCRKRMLLVTIKREMTEAAKQRLRQLAKERAQ